MPGVLPTPLLTTGGGGVALTLDASSPPLVVANATTVTTASFTPPVGSLLVAFAIGTSFSGNPNAVLTSTGLTFTSQLLNNGAGEGTVQVFTSLVGAAGGSARTVNLSVSGYASCGLKVYVLTGQHATLYVDNTSSGTSTANVINAAITTNNDGCMVLGGASEFIGLGVPTTTDAGEGLDDATGGVSYLAPRRAGETVKAGPELVNLDAFGASAASWYWILISIRPDTYTAPAVGKKADRGQASNTTTATSTAVAMAAAGSITTGNYLIARIALDNAGTSGAAPSCTITDPRSNTWTVVGPANRTAASAANDGSTCYIAYAKVTNAYTNGDSLTVNHSPTTPAKAINVEEWYGIDGTTPVAVASTTATGSSATPSIARTPLATGQLFYGAISAEGPATDAFTQDTDTTDGSWVTLTRVASPNATAASNQDIYGAAKLVTGTTAQTWNPNIGTSRDWAQIALVFAPASSGTTGTAAVTQASDASTGSGQLGYSGTSTPTQAANSSTATGTVANPVTGTAAVAQANHAAAASGQLGYTGTSAASQAANTSAATGQLGYSGTVARTQANNTSTASGQLGYAGTASPVQANNTSTASGTFTGTGISGNAAATQAPNNAAGSGQLGYSGTAGPTQAAQTSAASGQLGYTGTAATSQANQAAAASGTFTSAGSFSGAAAVTQANQIGAASGKLGYSGTAAPAQANNTPSASGAVVNPVTGTASPTQANQFSIANGVLRYSGTSGVTQAANASTATGTVSGPVGGTGSAVQANQTVIAVGIFTPLVSLGTAIAAVGAAATATTASMPVAAASAATMTVPRATGG